MADADLLRLLLAALLPAPFAVAAGWAVRDGREGFWGVLSLVLGSGTAVLVCRQTGSLLLAFLIAFALMLGVAYLRFRGAQRPRPSQPAAGAAPVTPVAAPPSVPVTTTAAASPPPSAPAPAASPALLPPMPADVAPRRHPLLKGLHFLGDVLEVADRIGELRHRRRLRQLRQRQTEREGAAASPPRYQRVRPRR